MRGNRERPESSMALDGCAGRQEPRLCVSQAFSIELGFPIAACRAAWEEGGKSVHGTTVTRRKLLSRKSYVLQALFILLAMSISLASLVRFVSFGGSPWWLVGADLLLLAACYQSLATLMETWVPAIAALDIVGIVLLAILILIAPLLSPIALGWTIRQAMKAGPQG